MPPEFDAANDALGDGDVFGGDVSPRRGEHRLQPGPRIGGAADDLQGRALAGVDLTHPQPVGVGMRRGLKDFRDAEGRQLLRRIVDMLDLKADFGQRLDDHVERRLGLEMGFQPGEGEFHFSDLEFCQVVIASGAAEKSARQPARQRGQIEGPESRNATASAHRPRRRGAGPACHI